MTEPELFERLLILAGKRADPEYHEWLTSVLTDESRRRGFLLALPNFFILLIASSVGLLLGDGAFAMSVLAAAFFLFLVLPFVPRWAGWRARGLLIKNGLEEKPS
jgi:Flp pilus assembly protein TadB